MPRVQVYYSQDFITLTTAVSCFAPLLVWANAVFVKIFVPHDNKDSLLILALNFIYEFDHAS
jgi:hypothetical protein